MELFPELKALYRHWPGHVREAKEPLKTVIQDTELRKHISWFIRERIAVWEKRTKGSAPPYTADPIIGTYRFCNIFREFDRQTIEFHTLLNPFRDDFPTWLLNMFYCRMVARPETVRKVGLLSLGDNKDVYDRLVRMPRPRYGTPYVFPVSTILKSGTPTREQFVTEYVPEVIPAVAERIQGWKKKSVYEGVEEVLPVFGFNLRFLWTEVLIDVAYQFPEYIDLYKRFPVGPGALPTFRNIDRSTDPSELAVWLGETDFDTGVTYEGRQLRLSAENWEGVGCEYRKYRNLSAGRGRRRLYI